MIAVAVAAALLSSGMTAYATQTFNDVPDTNPFFGEIEWMAATGISTGFPDGTYRPTDNVSRQAMSAFMQRLYDLQAGLVTVQSYGSTAVWSDEGWVSVGAPVSVTIPQGTTGRIHAQHSVTGSCDAGTASIVIVLAVAPTCNVRFIINGVPLPEVNGRQAMYSDFTATQSAGDADPFVQPRTSTVQAVSGQLGAGTYSVGVEIRGISASTTGNGRTLFSHTSGMLRAEALLDQAGS